MTKKSHAAPRSTVVKKPTTEGVVRRVQRSTSIKNGGSQSEYTRRLQSAVDKKGMPLPNYSSEQARPQIKGTSPAANQQRGAAKNNANQRNPNHEQFYKSRGLPGRPEGWDGKAAA